MLPAATKPHFYASMNYKPVLRTDGGRTVQKATVECLATHDENASSSTVMINCKIYNKRVANFLMISPVLGKGNNFPSSFMISISREDL